MSFDTSAASGPPLPDGTPPQPPDPAEQEAPLRYLNPAWWWRALWKPMTAYRWWVLWGLVVLAIFTLRELGLVISSVENAEARAFGPEVYTSPAWPTDTADLDAALSLWARSLAAAGAVQWHLFVDAALLVPAAGFLLYRLLQAVSPDPANGYLRYPPLAYVAADLVETGFTYWAFGCSPGQGCDFAVPGPWAFGVIHLLSWAKWLALGLTLLLIVTGWARADRNGSASLQQAWGQREPALHTSGLAALVAVFALLVAVPAGGPLEQIPDVLRGQIEDVLGADLSQAVVSGIALTAFIACVVIAVALASGSGPTAGDPDTEQWRDWVWPVVPPLLLGLVLAIAGRWIDGQWRGQPWTLALVVGAAIAGGYGIHQWRRRTAVLEPPTPGAQNAVAAGVEPAGDASPMEVPTQPDPPDGTTVVGWLAGIVVMAGAVGVVRASVPLIADGPTLAEAAVLAAACLGLVVMPGLLATIAGPRFLDALTSPARRWPRAVAWGIAAMVLGAVLSLASRPGGHLGGTTGAIAWSFAALALLVGGLAWASRRRWWAASGRLGLSGRVPWFGLVAVAWLGASLWDSQGGYHDARVLPSTTAAGTTSSVGSSGSPAGSGPAGTSASPTGVGATQGESAMAESFRAWAQQDFTDCRRSFEGSPAAVPMVLVAASGGGARAAYWTGQALDELFTRGREEVEGPLLCPGSLFAVSGVSGGSVGLATKLGLPPQSQVTSRTRVPAALERVTSDGPLAATAAALLLRDLPQPLTGIASGWPDRAAVLEDAMVAAAAQPGGDDPFGGATKELGDLGAGWWRGSDDLGRPVVVLNAASAADGCLVLSSTVEGLAVQGDRCAAAPAMTAGNGHGGVAGALDATVSLTAPGPAQAPTGSDACTVKPATLPAVTAAVLSARFPYVTPSGALRYCLPATGESVPDTQPSGTGPTGVTAVVQAVDGGYAERSGLATLLGIWSSLAPMVAACNAPALPAEVAAGADEQQTDSPTSCPTLGGGPVTIEPYVILLDNSPRSVALPPPSSRERELWIPPTTSRTTLLSTPVLEQQAAAAMSQVTTPGDGSGRYVRLAPMRRVGVQAPLGWVLSDASRSALQAAAAAQVTVVASRISEPTP